jgi:hypothetical protein
MASFVEKYGPPVGGAALMGKTVRRLRDGAEGVVRQQRMNGLMVWVPEQRRNLTFLNGTYEVVETDA